MPAARSRQVECIRLMMRWSWMPLACLGCAHSGEEAVALWRMFLRRDSDLGPIAPHESRASGENAQPCSLHPSAYFSVFCCSTRRRYEVAFSFVWGRSEICPPCLTVTSMARSEPSGFQWCNKRSAGLRGATPGLLFHRLSPCSRAWG